MNLSTIVNQLRVRRAQLSSWKRPRVPGSLYVEHVSCLIRALIQQRKDFAVTIENMHRIHGDREERLRSEIDAARLELVKAGKEIGRLRKLAEMAHDLAQ